MLKKLLKLTLNLVGLFSSYEVWKKAGKRNKVWPFSAEDAIEFAFRADGVDYFRFADPFKLPTHRAFAALSAYEALEMRCTRDFLAAFIDSAEKAVDNRQTARLSQLLGVLKERLTWICEPETVYQLAAVVYFDRNENPYRYDAVSAQNKIEKWKKAGVEDFFYSAPLVDWAPFSTWQADDLRAYLTAARLQTQRHTTFFSETASSPTQTPAL